MIKLIEANKKQNYYVYDIEIVDKINIYNYNSQQEQFLKIILYDPKNVSFLRDMFERGYQLGDFKKQLPNRGMVLSRRCNTIINTWRVFETSTFKNFIH